MTDSERIACLRADADELRADAPSGCDPASERYLEAYMLEVTGLWDKVERLKAELEWRDASRKRGAALVSQTFADIRSALGDVEQDVPNWDGSPIGLTAAVGNKVKWLEAENERLRLERDAAIYREIYPSNDDVSWLVLDGATYHGERRGPFPSQADAFDSVLSWVKYALDPANEPMPEVVCHDEDEDSEDDES